MLAIRQHIPFYLASNIISNLLKNGNLYPFNRPHFIFSFKGSSICSRRVCVFEIVFIVILLSSIIQIRYIF